MDVGDHLALSMPWTVAMVALMVADTMKFVMPLVI